MGIGWMALTLMKGSEMNKGEPTESEQYPKSKT